MIDRISFSQRRIPSLWMLNLFGATLFVGSFLMFVVELIVAKMLLPLVGGAPMVWNTCVVCFQVLLLVGYASAHYAKVLFGTRRSAFAYAAIVAAALIVVPFGIGAVAPPSHNVTAWLLLMLLTSIGWPFFALSMSAPLVQTWFAETSHPGARNPYALYVASNSGSLLALGSYSFVIEPTMSLGQQIRWWTTCYAGFAGLAACCAAITWRETRRLERPVSGAIDLIVSEFPSWRRRARWVALAFVPSSLMLAVTNYLSTDIAALPLLWIVPLSIYLLSLIVAFSQRGEAWTRLADRRMPLIVISLAVFMSLDLGGPLWLVVPIHLLGFAAAAMLCHGKLATDRPPSALLTEFYFWLALGGVIGGLFNTFAAPFIFKRIIEYPLVLVLACLWRDPAESRSTRFGRVDLVVASAVVTLTIGLVLALQHLAYNTRLAMYIPAILCLSQGRRPARFALGVAGMLLAGQLLSIFNAEERTLFADRTFFGVHRVVADSSGRYRSLYHGTTLHGMQAIAEARQDEPLTYYHRTGPFGQLWEANPNLAQASAIAVVGLGVGSLASYAQPGQRWTFFEIDPAVERIAKNPQYFTYLRTCGSRCDVVLGDGRLALAREQPNKYGLIVLDAFSSDAIPIHLMTTEAVSLYLTRLAPGGLLAFHISNRHLSLGSMLGRVAIRLHLIVLEQAESLPADVLANGKAQSNWVVMTRNQRDLQALSHDARWRTPVVLSSTPLWTDDFSNIVTVLKLR